MEAKKGNVTVVAVGLLVLLGVLASTLPMLTGDSHWAATAPRCAVQAGLLAEGGMRKAMSDVRTGTDPLSLAGTWFDIEGGNRIEYLASDIGSGVVSVTSRATACLDSGGTPATDSVTWEVTAGSEPGNPDLDEEPDKFTPIDSGNANVGVDVSGADPVIKLGDGKNYSFGAVWYGGNRGKCLSGFCGFGHGIRTRFDVRIPTTSAGDGMVFTIMNGVSNSLSSVGGLDSRGELLGYAGPGSDGNGIRPPKIGVEIDTWRNGCGGTSCASNSRCDTNDHLAIVAWGNDLVTGCHDSMDDNRHGAGDNAADADPLSGSDGVRSWPDGTFTNGLTMKVRVEVHRSLLPSADGKYCYLVRAWLVTSGDATPLDMDDLDRDLSEEPTVSRIIRLEESEHDLFETFVFGVTHATGAVTQDIEVTHFELAFRDDPDEMPSSGMVGLWDFSDPARPWLEYTGNITGGSVQGTLETGVPSPGCPACGAASGTGHLTIPDQSKLDLGSEGTLSMWIRPDGLDDFSGFVHKGDRSDFADESYSFQVWTSRRLYLCVNSSSRTAETMSGTLPLSYMGKWSHVAATWDRDYLRIYLNGAIVSQSPNTYGISAKNSSGDLQIGAQLPSGSPIGTLPFRGGMDQVRIYDKALSQEEIAALAAE